MFSKVRKKTPKFQGFQGTFQGKEKIQTIFKAFKVFKDRRPPWETCSENLHIQSKHDKI